MEGAKEYLDEHKSEHFTILNLPNGGIIATPNSRNQVNVTPNVNDMENDKPIDHGTQYFATHAEYIDRLKAMGLWQDHSKKEEEEMTELEWEAIREREKERTSSWREYVDKNHAEEESSKKEIKKEERAVRHNTGKARWALLPYDLLEEVVRVLEYGSIQYGDYNWMLPMNPVEIWESANRHMVEMHKGIPIDKQTGLSHSAHVITNMLFYMYHMKDIINQAKEERNGKESKTGE